MQSDRLTGQLSGAMREVDRHRQEKELAEQFQRRAEEKAAKVESEVRQMKRECRDQVRAAEAEVDALQKQLAEVRGTKKGVEMDSEIDALQKQLAEVRGGQMGGLKGTKGTTHFACGCNRVCVCDGACLVGLRGWHRAIPAMNPLSSFSTTSQLTFS